MGNNKAELVFKYFLWFVAIHSILTGFFLLLFPAKYLVFFGLPEYENNFFQAQGGIFHIIISYAYVYASIKPQAKKGFIHFIIFVKAFASFFLFTYFFSVEKIWIVLLSAFSDGLISAAVLIFYIKMVSYSKKLNSTKA